MAESLEISRTDAGTTYMGLAAEQFANTNSNFAKVTFNVTDGYQTIKPINATVTITENSGSEKYDGTEKTVTGYTVSISNPLYTEADFTFNGDATIKGTNAGTYNMELKPEDFTNISKNFTKVTFKIVDGTLEIAKRTVTLTSADDEKVYDGKALTNNEVTVGGDGWATGEGATYTVTGTQTEVGSSANAFTYTLNANTKADNYEITKTEGTLTVTALTDEVIVTITENSGSEKYDGTEKTVTGYEVTSISNPLYTEADFTFSGEATIKGTDAGTYEMENGSLGETTWYQYGESALDRTWMDEDGMVAVSKEGAVYKISGFLTCDDTNTYNFSFTGEMPFYTDDEYYPEGIHDVNEAIGATKILRDGQLIILRGEKTYTASGIEIR